MTRRISKSEAQANAEALVRRSAPYSQSHAASVSFSWDYRHHIPDDLRGLVRAARRAYEDEVPTKLHDAQIGEGGTPQLTERFVGYLDGHDGTDREERLICVCPSNRGMWDCGDAQPTKEQVVAAKELLAIKSRNRDSTPITVAGITWVAKSLPHVEDCPRNPGYPKPVIAYRLTPFRATLDRMERGDVHRKRRAAIVRHITIGGQEPVTAAIMEEAHPLDARIVAEDALRVFLNSMSDVKIDTRPEAAA